MGNLFGFVRDHFFHVLPILACGAVAALISFDRWRALFVAFPLKNRAAFMEKVNDLLASNRVGEAIALCDRYAGKPEAAIVKEALMRANQPEVVIEDGLALAVSEHTQEVRKRTPFLSTIANVSTLFGLLGTIIGLIQSFEAVGTANPQEKSALLAAGISTAMNATMLGLGVAIPCMILFSWFTNRANRLVGDFERTSVRSLDLIRQNTYFAGTDANVPARGRKAS